MVEVVGSKVEHAKAGSQYLRGTIADALADPELTAFSNEDYLTLKFHGIYQQDDRDVRAERTRQGLDVDSINMVRVSIPGGVLTADQYLAMDKLSDAVGNGTLRITTRQGIQFHFVRKPDLPALISTLNDHLVTTFGACGDVVRNTTCCPAPLAGQQRAEISAWAGRVAAHFRPKTQAYYQIWLDGEQAVTASAPAEEPLYGQVYLPRKFKFGFAAPDENCIDVFANDCGIVPLLDDHGELRAFTLLVGGGMGKSHTNPDTFPRLADPLTTVAPDDLIATLESIVKVFRDHGNRDDRDHARIKYLVDDIGIDRIRQLVGANLDRTLEPAEPFSFTRADDHLGWHEQADGQWFLGVKVENGRIADRGAARVRSGIRAVVERFSAGVRFTSREDALLTDIDDADRPAVDAMLRDHGVLPAEQWVAIQRNSFACPALPTCGLALTESERVMPQVLDTLHADLQSLGLAELDIHVRMTGCPNGCARPYTTEVGLVGRGKKSYDVHLGGDAIGLRLNAVFAENVPRDELANVLHPVFAAYRDGRVDGEPFGEWCHRIGVDRLRTELGNEQWVRKPRAAATA
ncbi:MAG: NADPH-dependent assimilatory sulfite reductase hemoprotein subunit [Acidimicrobiia bacterium]|nr:NADPH-dependent assimilatory sulfite reductase hemoprotein subunit [Acidimicrobiia bacterium]